MSNIYSTSEAAKRVGVNQRTLLRWLQAGEIPEPQKIRIGHDNRVWTEEEVQSLKAYKEQNYRKRS